jgi:hypothetical protein
LVDSIHIRTWRVEAAGWNAIDQAAGMAMSMPITVDPSDNATELRKWPKYSDLS